jgi:glycine dehydrogenase
VLYTGSNGRVAHECILDIRPLKAATGVSEIDIAKRLMDYGFHAPTVSFPVAGTMMVEPTESEAKAELDRFIAAMISIRNEIRQIEAGHWPADDNPLKRAPHTQADIVDEPWQRPYSRQEAVFPLPWWPRTSSGRASIASTTSTATATCSVPASRSTKSMNRAPMNPGDPGTDPVRP